MQGGGWAAGGKGSTVFPCPEQDSFPRPSSPWEKEQGQSGAQPSPHLDASLHLLEWRGLRVYCDSSLQGVPGDHFLVLELCPQPPPWLCPVHPTSRLSTAFSL